MTGLQRPPDDSPLDPQQPRPGYLPFNPPPPPAQFSGAGFPAEGSGKKKNKRRSLHTLFFEVAVVCVLAVGLAVLLRTFVAQAYEIRGDSMRPTLQDGQRVLIWKPGPDDLTHGDIVIFTDPNDGHRDLIKRVIGVPGDEVVIEDNEVRVNGRILDEDYVLRGQRGLVLKRIVYEGHIFVLGDNRANSKDSRNFGPVPIDSVKGTVFMRLWPLDSISTFE
ncbi:MAG: signal peptidase I [Planctomycetota bacterium]